MTWRTAHGAGASTLVRVETSPPDELPVGLPEPARSVSPSDRGAQGRFAGSNAQAAAGGRARAGKTKLTARLGLATLPPESEFQPYKKSAASFRKAQCLELARNVGGGVCGPGPSSIVASSALALAWSRYFSDRAALTGDPDLAAKALRAADTSRQMLLTAHELCAREGLARKANAPYESFGDRLDREEAEWQRAQEPKKS